jgi:hypothetical protein
MKQVFIIVTLTLGVLLVVMLFTKPEPQQHYDAMMVVAEQVADQEMTSDNVKQVLARKTAEKLSEFGIEGIDAVMLEQLGAGVDLTEVTEQGREVAVDLAGVYLRSHMHVDDYYVATVGILNYRGLHLPVTVGALGKIFVLADEEAVTYLLRQQY